MLELITEAVARGLEFKYAPGHFEYEEYDITYKDGVYRLTDTVSPVTAMFTYAPDVLTFIHEYMDK